MNAKSVIFPAASALYSKNLMQSISELQTKISKT